jgi:hypothetical protein
LDKDGYPGTYIMAVYGKAGDNWIASAFRRVGYEYRDIDAKGRYGYVGTNATIK